ncbi:MAG: nuclear transport factor 2 family protein [Gallionella sp.]|nr:nuclear transport factor 2 family protein [Gallionella sp.]
MTIDQIVADLISLYKTAWETHNDGLLDIIFLDDAVYIEKPTVVYCGISDIKRYWRKNTSTQSRVSFTPKRIICNDKTAAIEWSARFYRIDLGAWLSLDGTMWIILKDGRIHELKEHFFVTKE